VSGIDYRLPTTAKNEALARIQRTSLDALDFEWSELKFEGIS
jgi:hypothetical protein